MRHRRDEGSGQIESARAGAELDVQDRRVGIVILDQCQRLGDTPRGQSLEARLLDHADHKAAHEGLVLDDEDLPGPAPAFHEAEGSRACPAREGQG